MIWDDMRNNAWGEPDSKWNPSSSGWHYIVQLWLITVSKQTKAEGHIATWDQLARLKTSMSFLWDVWNQPQHIFSNWCPCYVTGQLNTFRGKLHATWLIWLAHDFLYLRKNKWLIFEFIRTYMAVLSSRFIYTIHLGHSMQFHTHQF